MAEDYGTIEAYEPSPLESQQQSIANFLLDKGLISDNYRAQRLGESITFLSELIPGFGDVQGLREGRYMAEEGSPIAGGIMMGASMIPFVPAGFIAKRVASLEKTIKKAKFDEQRELRNAGSGDGEAAYNAAERHRKKHIKAQRELDEIVAKEKAKPQLDPTVTKKETPKPVQQEFNLEAPAIITKDSGEELANKISSNLLYHGSERRGIESLLLPDDIKKLSLGQRYPSTGGIYTVTNPRDPRLKSFAKEGSVYSLNPNLSRTLDIENMPKDVRSQLDNLFQYISRPSRQGLDAKRLEYQLDTILEGSPAGTYKTPSNFSANLADTLKELEYDSLLFPPRKMKNESETLLSLDPSNLQKVNEQSYADFLKNLLND